jgi:hypothetical protein
VNDLTCLAPCRVMAYPEYHAGFCTGMMMMMMQQEAVS